MIQMTLPHSKQGYTLVETLVAAIIILLLILGTTSMVKFGGQVSQTDSYRQRSLEALNAHLEGIQFSNENYTDLTVTTSISDLDVVIDDRQTTDPADDVIATLSTTLVFDSVEAGPDGSTMVPFVSVSAQATWTDAFDVPDSISLEKRVCLLR